MLGVSCQLETTTPSSLGSSFYFFPLEYHLEAMFFSKSLEKLEIFCVHIAAQGKIPVVGPKIPQNSIRKEEKYAGYLQHLNHFNLDLKCGQKMVLNQSPFFQNTLKRD